MRACLVDGEAGSEALRDWLARVGDPVEGLRSPAGADRHLLPLLHHTRHAAGSIPDAIRSILRAAVAHEELRAEAMGAAAAEALHRLSAAGVDPLVVGGAVLAWGDYPAPALRHCHNIDLLVTVGELAPARTALAGFEVVGDGSSLRVTHPSGTRIALHTELHRAGRRAPARLETRELELSGSRVRALGPSDLVVQLCSNAAAAIDPGLRWLADGAFVCAGGRIDWDRARKHATVARRTAPLSTLLGWLAQNTPIDLAGAPRAALARSRRSEIAREVVTRSPRAVRNRLRRA
ncbi:MAG TPA: nucleotidyltransferase family protein [Gaiellaceae bacterium]|jgi:hypothetical protein|nr:nucleotidyltransferase family protein [Gaiellaceae bacterium]